MDVRTQMQNLALSMTGSEEPQVGFSVWGVEESINEKAFIDQTITLKCTISFIASCRTEMLIFDL